MPPISAFLCDCESQFGANTGLPNCVLIAGVTYTVMLQSRYDALGEENFIDLSDPTTLGATIKTLTSAATDPLSRLYPLPRAESVTQEKTATVYETAPSQTKYKVQEGIRTIMAQFWADNSDIRFLGTLNSFGCSDMNYYLIDRNGNIWGSQTEDGKLFGIPVSASSWDAMLAWATDTTVQKIMLQFDVEYGFNDATLAGITPKTLGYSATTLRGLITAHAVVVGTPTVTSAVVDIYYESSNAVQNKKPVKGFVTADFTVAEIEPTPGPIPVTASESGAVPARYTLTYATQTSGDTLEGYATRANFEVLKFQIAIP